MVIPPYLHEEHKAIQHEGKKYFINREWTRYAHMETGQPWYYNERTGAYQFDFPHAYAQEKVSHDLVPKGWRSFYCKKNDLYWWLHEATNQAHDMHPYFDDLQYFGRWKSKACEWNFNKLRDEHAVSILTNICNHVHIVLKE